MRRTLTLVRVTTVTNRKIAPSGQRRSETKMYNAGEGRGDAST